MQEMALPQVFGAIEAALKEGDLKRCEALVWPAVEQFPQVSQLWFYGGCVFYKTGRSAVAAVLFNKALELEDHAHVYSNLGACLRRMNLHDEGLNVLRMALDKEPDHTQSLVNMGAMFVNEGTPELGIPYLERARELGEQQGKFEPGTIWNLGLLYLEAGRFGEGFDCYGVGVTREREIRLFGDEKLQIAEPAMLTPDAPRAGKRLVVWGEQGIGDELMFGTLLEEARRDFGHVTFECHPRLETLHRQAHPSMEMYPTRKDDVRAWPAKVTPFDYKAPIGDLARLYRRTPEDFSKSDTEYSNPNPEATADYRRRLEAIAQGRPIVGLACKGGVMQTARNYRVLMPSDIDRLMKETDALFVALDYDDLVALANYIGDKHGDGRYIWFPSIVQHWDYHHVANLIAATDLTVTVCQSVAHLSAGMAYPTVVLTPKRCAWRYARAPGIPDHTWYWYPHLEVELARQAKPDDWTVPLNSAIARINGIKELRHEIVRRTVTPLVGGARSVSR